MYVKLENNNPSKWPVGDRDIRLSVPNKSLPEYIPDDVAVELGFVPFVAYGYPTDIDHAWEYVEEIEPELIDGKYHQRYKICQKYTSEEKQRIIADQEANKMSVDRIESRQQKAEQFLQESDWVELPSTSDATKTPHLTNLEEWITYRVALRSIAIDANSTTEFPTRPPKLWSSQ